MRNIFAFKCEVFVEIQCWSIQIHIKQDRPRSYNVTLGRVRATSVAVESSITCFVCVCVCVVVGGPGGGCV